MKHLLSFLWKGLALLTLTLFMVWAAVPVWHGEPGRWPLYPVIVFLHGVTVLAWAAARPRDGLDIVVAAGFVVAGILLLSVLRAVGA